MSLYTFVVVFQLLGGIQLLQPHGLQPSRLLCPWDFPGKNTGVGCHFLLQGTVLTQGSNLCFLHWQAGSFASEPPKKPILYTLPRVKQLVGSCLQHKELSSVLHENLEGGMSRGGRPTREGCTHTHTLLTSLYATLQSNFKHQMKKNWYILLHDFDF